MPTTNDFARFHAHLAEVVALAEEAWESEYRRHSRWKHNCPFIEIRECWLAEMWRLATVSTIETLKDELSAGRLYLTNN